MDIKQRKWYGWGLIKGPDLLKDKRDSFWNWLRELSGFQELPHTLPVEIQSIQIQDPQIPSSLLSDLQGRITQGRYI